LGITSKKRNMQIGLFDTIRPQFIQTEKWKEFHENGQIWIDGEIAIVKEEFKDLYDYRMGFMGHEGTPVVRIGIWTKYFDNGQLAWQLDHRDGSHKSLETPGNNFPSFQKDGTPIIRY
jgi:hypothetical protein